MPDLSALDKFPCSACGAQAQWNPARQLLVCPFCGTAAPFNVDAATGAIEELDLAKALRELPDEARGWQAEKRTVQCQSCKAVSVFDPERVGQNCDFCGSPALVDYQEIKAPIRPQSLLPFTVTEANVREEIRKWYASKWLAPNKLKSKALVDRVHGRLHPVLDVRRARRLPMGSRGRPLLLRRPKPTRRTDGSRRDRSARRAGCRLPARCGTSSTMSRSRERRASRTSC